MRRSASVFDPLPPRSRERHAMMSRTHKDQIQQSQPRHPNAPFWKYWWWLNHGRKRSSAKYRRLDNRRTRARARDLLVNEQEPFPRFRDIKYLYW